MPFNPDAIILVLVVLLAVIVLAILAYMMSEKRKARRHRRDIAAIRATIIDYFRRTGVEVSADCFSSPAGFTAVVESEPMKRFRLSHIIEMTVRDHVRKACGLELNKIYWRFPVKDAVQAAAAVTGPSAVAGNANDANPVVAEEDKKPEELSDDYINEGLEHYRHIPKPEVTELPWETFEQMAHTLGKENKDGA